MFTGLVEEVARVKEFKKTSLGAKLFIEAKCSKGLVVGDSVSLNGACQTVVSLLGNVFEVEVMNETLRHTNLESAKNINIERAMCLSDRLHGHLVSGHIDGVAKFLKIREDGFSKVLRFQYPTTQIILKGSICINGVSLTVSAVEGEYFEVSLIPHTLGKTNLLTLQVGDYVNIETDMVAKYIEKMYQNAQGVKKGIDENFLKENGF